MKEKALVLGAGGQLGTAFCNALHGHIAVAHEDVDITDKCAVLDIVRAAKPSVVINCAAYTNVEECEANPKIAELVNGHAPGWLASTCKEYHIPFVHFSTDYVFEGTGNHAHKEDEPTNPINTYGRSKLLGEKKVAKVGGRYLIFRTSMLYSYYADSLFIAIMKLARQRQVIGMVADQFGSPTFAPHLAAAVIQCLEVAGRKPTFPSGIYHLASPKSASRFQLAKAIMDSAKEHGINVRSRIEMCHTEEIEGLAERPANARLDTTKALRSFGVQVSEWTLGVEVAMERYCALHRDEIKHREPEMSVLHWSN